jgi:hypothetical protein
MERRRASGAAFSVREAIALMVPLCTELAKQHARGARLFVHPASIILNTTGSPEVSPSLANVPPTSPRDHACLAPEERHGQPGDARSSVFTIGAILYELLTTEVVGPGMVRPTQIVPNLPASVEVILGKALVTDRAHRPDDLGALAQALHHLAPASTVPPPKADESHLDQGAEFAVDVSLSMLPPEPVPAAALPKSMQAARAPRSAQGRDHASPADPYAMAVLEAPKPALRPDDPTAKLADLKTRLEADPRPRYVVVKDGMDHGPFNAVELLQQIGTHAFEGDHVLRDTFSNDDKPIAEWPEFASFAEQAKLNRDIVAEKRANSQVAKAEAKGTRTKTLLGIGLIGVLLAGGLGWYAKSHNSRTEDLEISADMGVNIESQGGIKGKGRKAAAHPGAGGGNFPVLAGGMTCEQARAKYVEEINVGGPRGQADLTAGQFGAVLNNGGYIGGCGTPSSMHVNVCAAVQNGRAVGVTVTTEPPNAGITNCITGAVRRMSFPSNPKLDVATTRF